MSSIISRRLFSRLKIPTMNTTRSMQGSTHRSLHITRVIAAAKLDNSNPSADTYAKDVDSTPAADKSVHRLDPDSDKVQKPHEPPSGEWSRAGVQTEEYRHVEGKDQPYTPKGGGEGGHAGRNNWKDDKGPETSGPEDGPDAKSSGGRK